MTIGRAALAAAVVAGAAAAAAGCAGARTGGAAAPADVEVVMHDVHGDAVAAAILTPVAGGVAISIRGSALPPGPHGLHLHEHGRCEPPDFASAGGRFDPDSARHGQLAPDAPLAGDLAGLVVRADGTLDTTIVTPALTLTSGPRSLRRAGGSALVLHAQADDGRSDPADDAGARIACGVVAP